MNPWEIDGSGLSKMYERKVADPIDVLTLLQERIESHDPEIGSFRNLNFDKAREEAETTQKKRSAEIATKRSVKPLYGVPIAVKEIIDVEGLETPFGSKLFSGRVPDHDAVIVRRLRQAGALIIGNTRSHEFAWGITTHNPQLGGTLNPWDHRRVPGGSSGGSAAAVASRFCPVALGTDTGGSIRIPANYCGVLALKPTFNAATMQGVLPLSYSLDHPGIFARSTVDLRAVWDVISDENPESENGSTPKDLAMTELRFGILPRLHHPAMDEDRERIFRQFCGWLKQLGGQQSELDLPKTNLMDWFVAIQSAEALHVHSCLLKTFPAEAETYGADVRRRLENARDIDAQTYIEARRSISKLARQVDLLFRSVDVIVLPTSAAGPSTVQDPDHTVVNGVRMPFRDVVLGYTVLQNLCGLPTCTVPAGFDENGIPVGIQVSGPKGSESLLLDVISLLEARTNELHEGPLGSIPPLRSGTSENASPDPSTPSTEAPS